MFAPPLSSANYRAVRTAFDWPVRRLSLASKVPIAEIALFEQGSRLPSPRNLSAMRATLEAAGVEFIPANGGGPRVRLRRRMGVAQ
jgi:hypothetical protein